MDKTLRIAAFQMNIAWEDASTNLTKVEKWVNQVDAELVVLPEMFATGFSMSPTKIAEPISGEIVNRMQALSKSSGKAIISSIAIKEQNKYYNRLFFFTPEGKYWTYDKRHTFRMGGEHLKYESGHERLVVNYRGLRICPLVCYDIRFPVWSRNRGDYDVLIYIASWPDVRNHAWQCLTRARAIENQCYCVGVNRCGDDPQNHYTGETVILDFMGLPIAQADPDKEHMIVAEISLDKLNEFRESFPAYLDADQFLIQQ